MQRASINDVELEYEVRGSGEVLLLIGTGPIADSFMPFMNEASLASRYRLIRYRQRGQTGSTRGGAATSFEVHASDAAALLERLGVERAHVAGHSTGAAIALQLALDHSDSVASLALLEPPLLAVKSAASFFERAAPALDAYASGDAARATATFLSVVCSLDWEACADALERAIPGAVASAIDNADAFFGSYLPALQSWQFDAEQARRIPQPVLSVVGSETDPLFAEGHELLRSWFAGAEELRIDGAAHLLHLQRPEPVVRGLASFVERAAAARAAAW